MNQDEHPNPADRWKNRRRMAWASLVSGFIYAIVAGATGNEVMAEIAWPFYTFIGAVVGSYVGFATIDDKWQQRGRFQGRSYDRFDF